jgi:type III restriction enzyme
MSNLYFDHLVLNSPYDYPEQHWELDTRHQPTQKIIADRRTAKFVTPIPKS